MEASNLSRIIQVMVIVVVIGVASYFAIQKYELGSERLNFGKTISLNNINIPISTNSLIMAVKAKVGVVQELAVGDVGALTLEEE